MSDTLASLRQYMPEWMATRGAALLGGLPDPVERWVQQAATTVVEFPGPPDRNAWNDEIVERFCQGRKKKEHAVITEALRCAVLLAAIVQMPPPDVVPGEGASVPADTTTKKLDRVALKRSRVLGMIETGLQAFDDGALESMGLRVSK